MSKRNKRGRPARETGALPSLFRFSQRAERHLQMIPHNELARVLKGMGTEESWHTLAVRVNVGAMMAKLYFNVEAQEAMTAAVHAVAEAGKRYVTTGKMILTGDESRAIGGGLNLTDEMQLSTTKKEQRKAMHAVYSVAAAKGRVKVGEVIDIMEAA